MALLFPPFINHSDFVRQLGCKKEDVLSAGFVTFSKRDGKINASCYGKSDSLSKEANPKRDDELVTRLLRNTTF